MMSFDIKSVLEGSATTGCCTFINMLSEQRIWPSLLKVEYYIKVELRYS